MKINPLTIPSIRNDISATAAINTNFDEVQAEFENSLSLDGSTPNSMLADFDMNSNQILNLPLPVDPTDVVRLQDLEGAIADVEGQLPTGGTAGQVLTKQGVADFDADWEDVAAIVAAVTSVNGLQGVVVLDAGDIPFTPAGNIAATDVQAAIVELDGEKLATGSYTAADVLAKLLTVDGPGTGLDADLLDGLSSAAFQPADADLTTWAGLTPSANAQSLVTAANYAAMRALLDLEAGTDFYSIAAADTAFQPKDADLTLLAAPTAWRVFYSNGTSVITELALGADGTFLKSNGAAAAPSFATPAGSGDVSKVGTPVNNQVGVWTGDGTLEGDAALTFDTATDILTIGASGDLAFGTEIILSDAAGTTTLNKIDALDATTEATIEAAIDTLANLTSIQSLTVTLADAGANAFFGWDDIAGAYENLTAAEAEAIIEPLIDTLANLTSVQGLTITLADAGADAIFGWDDSANAYLNLSAADVRTALGLATGSSPEFLAVNIGAATDTTVTRVSAGVIAVEGATVRLAGKETIWIPAGAMVSRATSGAATGTYDSGTNDQTIKTLAFDTTAQEYAHFHIGMPKGWDEGTVTFVPYWTNTGGASTETVVWSLSGVAVSNDDTLNAVQGTPQTSSDTWLAQNDLHIGPESAAITIGGTPAELDFVNYEVSRVVASDNMAGDALLIGIKLFITYNAVNDA